MPFATKICVTFPETLRHVKEEKGIYIGAVVREQLKQGNADKGRALCQFEKGNLFCSPWAEA